MLYLLYLSMSNLKKRGWTDSNPSILHPRRKDALPELTSDESREFVEDEIVWAKVVGHPWWPAVVAQKKYPSYSFDEGAACLRRKEVTYRVCFFGEPSHAYLEESKLAEYLPNRDYFIELAHKHSKRCNIETFRASVRQADIISDNLDHVEEVQYVGTPRKERAATGEQTGRGKVQEERVEKDRLVLAKENNKPDPVERNQNFPPFSSSSHIRRISQFLLRQMKAINKGKYTTHTLKKAVIRAIKRQKSIKRVDSSQPERPLAWIHKLLDMGLDEFVHAYCRRLQIVFKVPPNLPQEEKPSSQVRSLSKSLRYVYINELGTQRISSESLAPYDFQIDI